MMQRVYESLFGGRIRQETGKYLRELRQATTAAYRKGATELIRNLKETAGPVVVIGTTPWGQEVAVPLSEILVAFALIGGATGTGKSRAALLLIEALLKAIGELSSYRHGFGVLDAKGELFHGVLFLISDLERKDPRAAQRVRDRLVIIDFACPDPLTPYNFLAGWPGSDAELFAATRADLIMDLLHGPDKLSLGASGVLKKLILLLSKSKEPITKLAEVVENERLRANLLARCRDPLLTAYFSRQFPQVPKTTIGAILRRMDALVVSDSVWLALSGNSAPDFRRLQDEAKIVLINCFGRRIPRSVRRFLQALVFLDLLSAIFARECLDVDYLWCCDEAQNFFVSEQLREATSEIACTARSWHTHFIWLTQNFSTAVSDPKLLKILHTNMRWSLSLRSDPADCLFLKPVLPLTGRRPRPQAHPFEESRFYSETDERAIVFEEIAKLPNRSAYFWPKAWAGQAIPLTTADISIPEGTQLERATAAIRSDPTVGMRISREEYDRLVEERDREWREEPGDMGAMLKRAYQENRGQMQA